MRIAGKSFLNKSEEQVSKPTENTMKRVKQFLDYMYTHPDAKIRYRASDMILNIHSDASYLSATKARSRAGGYFFLGSIPQDGKRRMRIAGKSFLNKSEEQGSRGAMQW